MIHETRDALGAHCVPAGGEKSIPHGPVYHAYVAWVSEMVARRSAAQVSEGGNRILTFHWHVAFSTLQHSMVDLSGDGRDGGQVEERCEVHRNTVHKISGNVPVLYGDRLLNGMIQAVQ